MKIYAGNIAVINVTFNLKRSNPAYKIKVYREFYL